MEFQNLLSLKLTRHTNTLDGIVLYEPIEQMVLEKLINSTLLRKTFNNPMARIHQTEKKQLEAYLQNYENGKVKVIYKKKEGNPYGRSNPIKSLGLYSIRREIRHTLAKNKMIDVDIANAHPQIFYQIMKHNKKLKKKSMLENYVLNRKKWIDGTMEIYSVSKDCAKVLFIIILYGGGFKRWVETYSKPDENGKFELDIKKVNPDYVKDNKIVEYEEVNELIKEIKDLSQIIIDNNPDLVEIIKEQKDNENKDYYINSSTQSFFLQEIEVRILEVMYKYCLSKKYIVNNVCSLCADGLMLEAKYTPLTIADELHNIVLSSTGLNLQYEIKEMNKDYLNILDNSLEFDLFTPSFTTGLIASYFRILYQNKFINIDDKLYIYNGMRWIESDKKHSLLHNFIDTKLVSNLDKYISPYFINNANLRSKLVNEKSVLENVEEEQLEQNKLLIKKLEEDIKQCDADRLLYNQFLSNVNFNLRTFNKRKDYVADIINKLKKDDIKFDDDPYILAFNNKVFDLHSCKTIDTTYDMYIKNTTGYDWNDYYETSKIKELNKLIDTIFPNKTTKDYYMTVLSTGMYGEQVENLFVATGKGGNGKSLINSLMCEALGNYAYKLPSSVLLNDIKEGGNPQIANMDKKRFILTQEPDGKKKINTSTVKEITGDKKLNARLLNSNKCKIDLCLTLIMECNKLPNLDEVNDAMQRRIRGIPFVSRFVDEETYNSLEDKTNTYIGNIFYKSDEFQKDYKQGLVMLLFNYWTIYKNNNYKFPEQSEECKKVAKDYLATSDNIFEWFNMTYELNAEKLENGDPKYTLKINDILQEFQNSNLYINMNKNDKRSFNIMNFKEKLSTNMFLSKYYKDREAFKLNKKYIKSPLIINWKLKELDDDDEEPAQDYGLDD
jgi:phage/plasmid-associated DNA primase